MCDLPGCVALHRRRLAHTEARAFGEEGPVLDRLFKCSHLELVSLVNGLDIFSCPSDRSLVSAVFAVLRGDKFHFPESPAFDDFGPLSPFFHVSRRNFEDIRRELACHPDWANVHYLLNGIEQSFLWGFDSSLVVLRSSVRNLSFADDSPEVIDEYLAREVSNGSAARPFPIFSTVLLASS